MNKYLTSNPISSSYAVQLDGTEIVMAIYMNEKWREASQTTDGANKMCNLWAQKFTIQINNFHFLAGQK